MSGFTRIVPPSPRPRALAISAELLLARPSGLWPALPDAALQLGAVHLLTVGWLLQLITGVAEAMPADKYNAKPTPAQQTFGERVMHIATTDLMTSSRGGA